MFQIKVVDKIKTHALCEINFSENRAALWDKVENYGGARVATDNDVTWRRKASIYMPDN